MSRAPAGSPGMQAAPVVFTHVIAPEDQARADLYALLSRLYSAAPDAALLAAIASADDLAIDQRERETTLARDWTALIAASSVMDPNAADDEYQELFVGVGQSEISLHGSAYVKASGGNALLVDVREALDQLGLARQPGASMFEDHLAAVCETMRLLITGSGQAQPCDVGRQRQFFENNVATWVFACCSAIIAKPVANYYRRVAQFTESFMALERDAFAIE
ncbi:MAG TPA: molecular chaperone TorD family protein [Casimicrobiaceae bacterium]|nr:molecular chaperone TorD family protein [Casimicrobiaceae bacterium]